MWGDSKTRRRRSSSSKKNKKKQQDQAASISSVTDVDLSLAVQGKKNIHLLQVGIDGVAAGISKTQVRVSKNSGSYMSQSWVFGYPTSATETGKIPKFRYGLKPN